MKEIKGYRLYVNFSPFQVRRRLKGESYAVRKVQSGGRHQALVMHMASGQLLRALKSLFQDTIYSESEEQLGTPVSSLRNLGPTTVEWLGEVGIQTKSDLERIGPARAYQLVKQRQPHAGLNLMWAMAAALSDQDWREL